MTTHPRRFSHHRHSPLLAAVAFVAANLLTTHAPARDRTATWRSATSGQWDVAANWNVSPNASTYPNNDNKDNYDVRITATGADYVVTFDSSATVDSLLINTNHAILDQVAGTLTVPTFTLSAGVYNLRGGTLRDATLSGAGTFYIDPLLTPGATAPTLDNVTLATDATLVGQFPGQTAPLTRVVNGLTLSSAADINLYSGGLDFSGSQTLDGTGQLLFAGTNPSTLQVSSGTLTMQSGINTQTVSQDANILVAPGASLQHLGTLSSNVAGRTVTATGALINYGTIQATSGGALRLTGIQNAGSISVAGTSTLLLDGNWSATGTSAINLADTAHAEFAGTFSTDSLVTVIRTGSATLHVTGTVDNTGDTLLLDTVAGGAAWPLYTTPDGSRSGKVRGGTLSSLNPTTTGLVIPAVPANTPHPRPVATFESLTLATHTYLSANATLNLAGDVSLAAGRNILVNTGGTLNLTPNSRLLGPGAVILNTTNSTLRADASATLAPGSTVMAGTGSTTIQGPTTPGQTLSLQGAITGQLAGIDTLTLTGNWSNTGTIRSNGDKIILAGNSTSLGTLDGRVGSISLAGTYDNTGKTLALSSSTGPLYFGLPTTTAQTGTIKGGTLSNADAQSRFVTLYAPGVHAGTLDGVTLAGYIGTLNSDVHVTNSLTLNNASLSLGAGKLVFAGGTQTLGGTGEILFDGGNGFVPSTIELRNAALTIAPGVTARTNNYSGAIQSWDNAAGPASSLTNHGTISSDNSRQLFLNAPTFINHGTISLTGGSFGSFVNLDNRGTFSFVAGGPNRRLQFYGNWSNTGTFTAHDAQLTLGGTFPTATLLSLQRTGTEGWLEVLGTIDNTGATLALDSFAGPWPFLPRHFNPTSVTGSITGGTVTATNPAGLTASAYASSKHAGTFDNLTIDTDVTLAANLELRRTITLPAGRTLRTTSNTASGLTLNNAHLVGSGEVLLDSGASLTTAPNSTDNLIGPGITVRTGPSFSSATVGNFDKLATRLTTQGLITNDKTGGILTVAGTLNNTGTFRVSNGSTLRIIGTVENLGTLHNLGGNIEFSASYDNTGKTLALDDSTGSLLLYHSTSAGGGPQNGGTTVARFIGGTLSTSGSAVFRLAPMTKDGGFNSSYFGPTAEFDGVTLAGRVDVDTRGHLRINNGITLDNAVINLANDDLTPQTYGTNVYLPWTSPLLGGTGTFRFTGTGALGPTANRISFGATAATLDTGVTILTASTSGSVTSSQRLTNNGTLAADAPGKTLLVEAYPFINNGTLRASNSGTLELRGDWSGSGPILVDGGHVLLGGSIAGPALSNIQRTPAPGGTITLAGIVNNGGNTIALSDATGPLRIAGSILGGTLSTSGNASLDVVANSTLTSVAINGNVNVSPNVRLTVATAVPPTAPGAITLNNSTLEVRWTNPLAGPLDVILNGDPNGPLNDIVAPVEAMTIGQGVTIRTGTNDGRIGFDKPFVNHGTLLSNLPGGVLEIHRPTNHGLIRATAGGIASLANFTNAPAGTLAADAGGSLVLYANAFNTFSNEGAITASAASVSVSSGTWSNSGSISAINNSTLDLRGTWTNTGSITLADSTLKLGPTLPASLGNISATNSTIQPSTTITTPQLAPFATGNNTLLLSTGGTLDNTGHTLDLASLAIRMSPNSQLRGGTLTSSAPSPTPISATGGSLYDLTLDVPLTVTPPAPHTFPSLFFTTTNTALTRPATLTGSGINSRILFNGAWSNTSTLTVNSASLTLPDTGSNTGTLVLNDTSLIFKSFASLGTVHRTGGTAIFTGTVDNAGSTFDPNATPVGPVLLGSEARVNGGTLSSASPVTIVGINQLTPVTFDAVTLDADLELAGKAGIPGGVTGSTAATLQTLSGLTLANNATISLSPPATIRITGDQTYSGTGQIVLNGGTLSVGGHFTLGPGLTLRSGSTSASFRWTSESSSSFTNQGLVLADNALSSGTAGPHLALFGTFHNPGTVRATSGSTLILNGLTNISPDGTLTGGTYEVFNGSSITFPRFNPDFPTAISTNNATILLSGPNSTLAPLDHLSINNGSLTLTDGRGFVTRSALLNTGSITLGPSSNLTLQRSLTNTGTIDLAAYSATLVLLSTDPASLLDFVRQQLHDGHILTSSPDPLHHLAYTTSASPSSVIVFPTLAGDLNLDRQITPDDYALLDRAFAMQPTNPHYTDGDLNYDGQVTPADYLLLDQASYHAGAAQPFSPAFLALRESQFGPAYVTALLTSVPEPSSLACLFAGSTVAMRRRRRRH